MINSCDNYLDTYRSSARRAAGTPPKTAVVSLHGYALARRSNRLAQIWKHPARVALSNDAGSGEQLSSSLSQTSTYQTLRSGMDWLRNDPSVRGQTSDRGNLWRRNSPGKALSADDAYSLWHEQHQRVPLRKPYATPLEHLTSHPALGT